MDFTYRSYINTIDFIRDNGYYIRFFGEKDNGLHVILRHDIDMDINKAYKMAKIEKDNKILSTYCFLLSSPFYNIFNNENNSLIKEICSMGHRIGLHFDTTQYQGANIEELKNKAEIEKKVLTKFLDNGIEVNVISFHRPDKRFLGKDIIFNNMENTYSSKYFNQYKYLSDSRMVWKENVVDIIKNKQYRNIQLLTHPIWYSEKQMPRDNILKLIIKEKNEAIITEINDNFNLDKFNCELNIKRR